MTNACADAQKTPLEFQFKIVFELVTREDTDLSARLMSPGTRKLLDPIAFARKHLGDDANLTRGQNPDNVALFIGTLSALHQRERRRSGLIQLQLVGTELAETAGNDRLLSLVESRCQRLHEVASTGQHFDDASRFPRALDAHEITDLPVPHKQKGSTCG
jgi:hypothetical protein